MPSKEGIFLFFFLKKAVDLMTFFMYNNIINKNTKGDNTNEQRGKINSKIF